MALDGYCGGEPRIVTERTKMPLAALSELCTLQAAC